MRRIGIYGCKNTKPRGMYRAHDKQLITKQCRFGMGNECMYYMDSISMYDMQCVRVLSPIV